MVPATMSELRREVRAQRLLFASATLEAGHGGIARVGRMSARALIEVGYDVSMLTYLDGDGIEISGRPARFSNGSKMRFALQHAAMLPQFSCTIYDHVGLSRGRLPDLIMRRPYCLWIHGEEIWEDLKPDHKKLVHAADLILVNSRYTLDRFAAMHGSLPRAQICWLSTETDDIEVNPPKAAGPPTVLMIGRIEKDEPGKGHQQLIECWQRIVERVPSAVLSIAGRGSGLAELKSLADRSSARAQIRFLGFVPEDQMDALWREADVFALPSRQEGFGIVYVEAMARGIPVIASIHDAGQEVNIDGQTGFNVSLPYNDQIVDRVTRLLLDRDLRSRMGQAGRERWQRNFQYASFRNRFLKAIGPLVQRPIPAPDNALQSRR